MDLAPGVRFCRGGAPMTLAGFRDFGALLGTDAPIHTDPAYAAGTVFGCVIAQGPLLFAPFESWLCALFGEEAWSRSGRIRMKFLDPARVGETLTLEMTIRSVLDNLVEIELQARCAERLLAAGSAEIMLED